MRKNRFHTNAFCTLLAALSVSLAACGGGGYGGSNPAPAPTATLTTLPASAFTTATCNTSGATSASIAPGNLVGVTTITTPVLGGCSYANNFATVVNGATGGTYAGTISLTAPAGLPVIPNAPPSFAVANFVPLFYVTLQLIGYVGNISGDNPSINIAVNSITTSSNSSNFFIGSWSTNTIGSTPPAISSTAFIGWSNSNSVPTSIDVPLTVTPPNTLSLPTFLCTPPGSCTTNTDATATSYTLVQVVGYFT
jgi:hypothetical protein